MNLDCDARQFFGFPTRACAGKAKDGGGLQNICIRYFKAIYKVSDLIVIPYNFYNFWELGRFFNSWDMTPIETTSQSKIFFLSYLVIKRPKRWSLLIDNFMKIFIKKSANPIGGFSMTKLIFILKFFYHTFTTFLQLICCMVVKSEAVRNRKKDLTELERLFQNDRSCCTLDSLPETKFYLMYSSYNTICRNVQGIDIKLI